jgi:hypothetical protein
MLNNEDKKNPQTRGSVRDAFNRSNTVFCRHNTTGASTERAATRKLSDVPGRHSLQQVTKVTE